MIKPSVVRIDPINYPSSRGARLWFLLQEIMNDDTDENSIQDKKFDITTIVTAMAAELERRIDNGSATDEEKELFDRVYKQAKSELDKQENEK